MNFDITNYDVLLTRDVNGHCTVISGENVGNRRFSVILDIHRERYNLARMGNDTTECEQIVNKIINTVCNECVPNGRFLEKVPPNPIIGQGGGCRQLYPPEIKTACHVSLGGVAPPMPAAFSPPMHPAQVQALQNAAVFAEINRRNALQRSISESMIVFPPAPLQHTANDFHRSLSLSANTCVPLLPDPNTMHPNLRASFPNSDMMALMAPHLQQQQQYPPARRRGGVLATSMPPPATQPIVDRRAAAQHQAAKWTSAPSLMSGSNSSKLPLIPDTSMDVIISRNGDSISSSTHAGNNRFRVLVDLQTKPFADAGKNVLQKENILDDILKSVKSWSGTFLLETEQNYQWMTTPQVKESLRKILQVASLRANEINLLKARQQRKDKLEKLGSSDSNLNYNDFMTSDIFDEPM